MKVRTAVIWAPKQGFDVTEVELDPPKEHEVLVRWVAAGLCHSDYHVVEGGLDVGLPMVAGHEGAGIVEAVGPGVTRVKPGDHVLATAWPSCGYCRWCSTGHQNLCELEQRGYSSRLLDGTCRFHARGMDVGSSALLGTFSEHSVVPEYSLVKIDPGIPLHSACLLSCGVLTGWGAAAKGAQVEPGDTVVVYGAGGVGLGAVQGARICGARHVVAVDPVALKREKALELGATHAVAGAQEARELVKELTGGVGADKAIVAVGVVNEEVVEEAVNIIRRAGTVAVAAAGERPGTKAIRVSAHVICGGQKRIQGVTGGNLNIQYDTQRLLGLYRSGLLKLDEMLSKKYRLEDINQGYEDLLAGRIIRGIIAFGDGA